jgi:hypothetical protein
VHLNKTLHNCVCYISTQPRFTDFETPTHLTKFNSLFAVA